MSTAATPIGFELAEKVLKLKELLLAKHPEMPNLLRTIHTTLRQYPESMTLASEEEIQTIVQGLMVQTGVEFALAASKGSGKASANAKIKADPSAALGL